MQFYLSLTISSFLLKLRLVRHRHALLPLHSWDVTLQFSAYYRNLL